jgi:clan AA aspartic protease
MIRGVVTDQLEAVIRLTVVGAHGQKRNVEAVIDTGFDGFLSLGPRLIAELDLSWFKRGRALLADGSESLFDVFEAVVLWDKRRRQIFVDEADTEPLVGMALMVDFELHAQIWPGGHVAISRRP